MYVKDPNLVLVRGINSDWFKENFVEFRIVFGGAPQAIPKDDAYYVGLYLEAPASAITHIGIVESIERYANGADFYLKAIIKLEKSVHPGHAIRKHENWSMERLGLSSAELESIRSQIHSV